MLLIKIISILLLFTPALNVLLLHIFKNKYIGYVIKAIHLSIFLSSLFLLIIKTDFSFMLFILNIIALLLLIIVEKVYNVILNIVLVEVISQLANTNVISTVLITTKIIYALTTKGYIIIYYNTEDYKIHKDIQEFSASEQIYLKKLNKLKFKESSAK